MLLHVEVGLTQFRVPCVKPVRDMKVDGFGECFAVEHVSLIASYLVLKHVGIPHYATVEILGIAAGDREGKLAILAESWGFV